MSGHVPFSLGNNSKMSHFLISPNSDSDSDSDSDFELESFFYRTIPPLTYKTY